MATHQAFTWVTQIDSYFQALPVPPSTHVIIEPHPDVLKYMREQGWYDKKGVIIFEGKWQDFVDSKILDDVVFDVVYTDTFSEEYEGVVPMTSIVTPNNCLTFEDLRRFFNHVPKLLAGPDARFSFFNGLGATSMFFSTFFLYITDGGCY
jgi:type IV protein arginine methyltransferase